MYNNLVFHNRFNNGDVFESREFVKAVMSIIPARNYFYVHSNSRQLLKDIGGIHHIVSKSPDMGLVSFGRDAVYIDTWIGNGKYGCLVENNYDMFNEILSRLNFGVLPGIPIDYLPAIDYRFFDITNVNKFMADNKYCGKKVLIDNGDVRSLQAYNFDFEPIILDLADSNKDNIFIVTSPIKAYRSNIHYTGNVIKSQRDSDLMEISYLAKYCDVIVGRNSGPFVFSSTAENLNSKKTFISLCYEQRVSTFHVNQAVRSRQVWSGATSRKEVFDVINNEL